MLYIGNAFSFNMLGNLLSGYVLFDRITPGEAGDLLRDTKFLSCFGHADIASVVSSHLGKHFPQNRCNVGLEPGDSMILAQYIGPRLPEGTTELPPGASIEYFYIRLKT